MKFSIQIEKPLNGRAFGPGDAVRGRVELPADMDATAAGRRMPDVAVVFQGTVRLSIVPQTSLDAVAQVPNAASQRTHTYTLFSHSVTATPKPSTTTDGRVVYAAPFTFRFPTGSSCCDSGTACALPPSIDLNTAKIHANVVYSVTASARRIKQGGLQLLPQSWRRQLRAQQVLAFAPDLPIAVSSAEDVVSADATALSSTATMHMPKTPFLATDDDSETVPDSLPPPYSSSMALALELVMPQPAVIAPGGGGVALGVFLRTPADLLLPGSSGATLRGVRVQLRRETAARIGSSVARAAPVSWPLWSVEGAVPLREERLDITAACGGIWATQCCVPAAARPSFRSCYLSQAYTIEVDVGVSASPNSPDIRYMHASIDVVVSDPPPEYCTESTSVQNHAPYSSVDLQVGMGGPSEWSGSPVAEVRV